MLLLDLSLVEPAENLALDEALLECAEQGQSGEVLRWWESPVYFVVLGAGGSATQEVRTQACEELGIPVLRRCSGGGTVVQGPGCMNYTLILDRARRPQLSTIDQTNDWVLGELKASLNSGAVDCTREGTSDLTCDGFKFSGNAQRRRKRWILFHGTLLYNFELGIITDCLTEPAKQPDYRNQREHSKFVRNLPVDIEQLKSSVAEQMQASRPMLEWPGPRMRELVVEKYGRPDWNHSL